MMKDSTYALHHGSIVHVDNVPSGLSCECTCPACGTRMIARHGKIKTHHFAHYHAKTCATGYQTAVHMRAKELLSEKKELYLPPHQFVYGAKVFHVQSTKVQIKKVELEKRLDKIIPDVVVTTSKGQIIFVEIFVTHKIDDKKLAIIKSMDIPTIEIDLSNCELNDRKLIEAMNDGGNHIKWIYYGKESFYIRRINGNTEKITIDNRGRIICPILKAVSFDEGNPIVGYRQDNCCSQCFFLLNRIGKDTIMCMGKQYFSDIYQLNTPVEKRREDYLHKYFDTKTAFKSIEKSLLEYAKIPYAYRIAKNRDWHPLDRLQIVSILSIKKVFDVCKIPRLKIEGENIDKETISFYICVVDSLATSRLWLGKCYKDYVKSHEPIVVVYAKVRDSFKQYKYEAVIYLKDVPSNFYINSPQECFSFYDDNDKYVKKIPLQGVEEKDFYKIGDRYYAKCYRSYKGDNDYTFVPAEYCSQCFRYKETLGATITKFLCFTDRLPENTPNPSYEVLKEDGKLRNDAIAKGLVNNNDKYLFIKLIL
ncbi:MAG: hypothetical protein E7203_09160 [Selenomonas ruminantium]|uniref:Competence protein CoiA-like N-terminal domain-containing protein n=1 Tax=Selenomonas ruminantium TaxID=971 RepID=A0A927WIX0_SELRU|nr:competence protein CoiA family protein [Selenomonas ruminantium]MBE6085596.1 hypothetical protein [Selenomonas ruminantium]